MSQLLDNTQKMTKNREKKIKKLIFGSELSVRRFLNFWHQKKMIKQSFNKTIIYFYGKSIQMEIINNIILETRAYS